MSTPLPPLTPDVASQIARRDPVLSQNKEPGFANTYGPGSNMPEGQAGFLIPAAGMSALGLYLLYRKRQQDQLDEEKTAAIDWQAVRSQLPNAHVPDLLLGGAAGAGAGVLYDYFRGSEKGKRFPTALRRILTGAALGAGATNLVGDRFRRYLTNSVVPAGYDGGNIINQLKPRSLQHVYDAAIKDKPSYDPAKVKEFVKKFKNTEVGQRVLAARREIERIGQGVNLYDEGKSVWQRNPDKTYSINEKNKDHARNLAALFLPTAFKPEVSMIDDVNADLFQYPRPTIDFLNKGEPNNTPMAAQINSDFFGTNSLLGAQQLIARQNGPNVDAMILDRHDITPADSAVGNLTSAVFKGKVFDPKWRAQVSADGYEKGQTNSQVMRGTVGRLLWDRVLRRENPWVTQKFQFSPTELGGQPEFGLNMLRQDNTPVFSRPLNRGDMYEYLQTLQGADTIPEIK